jgi:hypothetical protein
MSKSFALRQAALRFATQLEGDFNLDYQTELLQSHSHIVSKFLADSLTPLILSNSRQEVVSSLALRSAGAQPVFLSATLEDLSVNPATAEEILSTTSPKTFNELILLQEHIKKQSLSNPLVSSEKHDRVYGCLAFNAATDAKVFLSECYRVVTAQGALMLSVLLSDEVLKLNEPFELDGHRVSQVPTESGIAAILETVGFHGLVFHLIGDMPIKIIKGVELRLFIITAYKGKYGPCFDQGHAVIYLGPWKEIIDDDGHIYRRGIRTAVCAKTFNLLHREPYAGQFIGLRCYAEPPLEQAQLFNCNIPAIRDPAVTKGNQPISFTSDSCCSHEPGGCC